MLYLLLFLIFSSVSPGFQQTDEDNTEVVDNIIRLFDEMAAPSDQYLEALDRFEKAIPAFLNLSESFGDLFYFPETFGNEEIPSELIRDMIDVPSTTKLYNYFSTKYGVFWLTQMRPDYIERSSYYMKAAIETKNISFSMFRDLTLPLNVLFKYGIMGFLNPTISPEKMVQDMKQFYNMCAPLLTIDVDKVLREEQEINKKRARTIAEDNTRLLDDMEDFLGLFYGQYYSFDKAKWQDVSIRFKSTILSIDDREEARKTIKKMKHMLLHHNWEKDERVKSVFYGDRFFEKVKIIFQEADNIPANRTVHVLDMVHGYNRTEITAFLNDVRFEFSRMLMTGLLCAAPDPKKFEKSLKMFRTIYTNKARAAKGYFTEKMKKSSIHYEEKIAKKIIIDSRKRSYWTEEYYISDGNQVIKQLNRSLWHVGQASIRRQYLLIQKGERWARVYQNYFTCKQDSCFLVEDIARTDTLVTRHLEVNETDIEEFHRQAKHLYRKMMPVIMSSNENRDTVEKIVGEMKSRGISLTDTHIGSIAIIRHKTSQRSSCDFKSYFLADDRGEDNLQPIRRYRSRHRVIQWFWDDYYACTEVYFFIWFFVL